MDEQIETALQHAFPDRSVAEVGSTGPSWNDLNRTVELTFDDGDTVYLKISTAGDRERIARERALLEYVGATVHVPVPSVAAADPEFELPYLVTRSVDGESLIRRWAEADTPERRGLVTGLGRTFATLHAERFESHGTIVGGGADGLELEPGSWTDVLIEQIEQKRRIAPGERFPDCFDRVIEAVEANRELLDGAKESGITSGKSPVGLAASAVYAAALLSNEKVTQSQVSEVADISEVTIRNRYKELLDASEGLTA